METKRKKKGIIRLWIIRSFAIVALLASVLTVVLGVVVCTAFRRELPNGFFGLTAKGISPQFYAYRFSDRSNRIGEEYLLSDQFFAQKRSVYIRRL